MQERNELNCTEITIVYTVLKIFSVCSDVYCMADNHKAVTRLISEQHGGVSIDKYD